MKLLILHPHDFQPRNHRCVSLWTLFRRGVAGEHRTDAKAAVSAHGSVDATEPGSIGVATAEAFAAQCARVLCPAEQGSTRPALSQG